MSNIMILLESINVNNSCPNLEAGKITKIKLNKKLNLCTFFISLKEVLPIFEYQFFIDQLNDLYPHETKVKFNVENNCNDLDLINDYYTYFIQYKIKENDKFLQLKEANLLKNDNELIIMYHSNIQLFISQTKKEITNFFKDIGINSQITFLINDNIYDEINEQIDKAILETGKIELPIRKENNNKIERSSKNIANKKTFFNKGYERILLKEASSDINKVEVVATVFKVDLRTINNDRGTNHFQTLYITDYSDSIKVKRYAKDEEGLEKLNQIKKGDWLKIQGELQFDERERELVLNARNIEKQDFDDERQDLAVQKRVELHLHTKMSVLDGVNEIEDYIRQAAKWGHKAIAITDHGVVQAYPQAQYAAKKHGIKMLYGVETNLIDPELKIVSNPIDCLLQSATYVVFDLETTGLSNYFDEIIEFGAVKVENGQVIDRIQFFVNPKRPLSATIMELTKISNSELQKAQPIEDLVNQIKEFIGDAILVAHNAKFDIGFLNAVYDRFELGKIENPVIDTLDFARALLNKLKYYRLGSIARNYKIAYDEDIAHRADYDAEVLYHVLFAMIADVQRNGINNINQLNDLQQRTEKQIGFKISEGYKKVFAYHATLLAKNSEGLKNIFRIVSIAHTDYIVGGESRIPRVILEQNRKNVLVGSSCVRGEVFEIAMNQSDYQLEKAIDFYDYIEIQPLSNYSFLVDIGQVENMDRVKEIIKRIVEMAKKLNKIIVATGDAHYLGPNEKLFRDVLITAPGIGGAIHPLYDRRKRIKVNPDQHLRTTDEMLKAFDFLGSNNAYEFVVTNTNKIADSIDEVFPLKKGLFTPKIDGVDQKLTTICYQKAHEIYGEVLPDLIKQRLQKELDSIIGNGFAVIYYISHLLVKKSLDDGYLVGSRGSVGSSFVATMASITEVNPLVAHYVCLNCHHFELNEDEKIASGYDLPDKSCPVCNNKMIGDGQDIPFETFLGFEGDKVPDIDLNFSGDYQGVAHNYTKEMLGENYVFRAGTIGSCAEKTAFGFAKRFAEEKGIENSIRSAELERLAKGIEGVKRTTGQHPGGIIVIPDYMDVLDFTPYQFPADDVESAWKTTHFDFNAIHDNVLKLDILGHVDPTAIRMLQDLTNVDPKKIPTNDPKVMSLFNSTTSMGISLEAIRCDVGSLGIPEFGTEVARNTLEQTRPTTFNELVILSGLSHGTGVWAGNAQELVAQKICTLKEVIGCRDDIMVYLIHKNIPNKIAFDIMESVRKGKGLKTEWVELMKQNDVPNWYIDSCKKIQYMFPKAHAVAYVLMGVRVAWFKIYYPLEYYATYFTTRCSTYDIEIMTKGKDSILNAWLNIKNRLADFNEKRNVSDKEKSLLPVLEIAYEMYLRGYKINPINLEYSDATNFILDPTDKKALIPPFITIDGLGDSVALSIVKQRQQRPFISKQDLVSNTLLSTTLIKKMDSLGILKSLQEKNQLSLF